MTATLELGALAAATDEAGAHADPRLDAGAGRLDARRDGAAGRAGARGNGALR